MIGLWIGMMILGSCTTTVSVNLKIDGRNLEMDKFAGGSGTAKDPYKIANAVHLSLVREELDKHFELFEDIDLSVIEESEGFEPIGDKTKPFTGTFDGKGKKIKNLKINRSGDKYVGLFGVVGRGGVVKNIGLEDVDVKGEENVGGLVGYNNGMIENSYTTGNVAGGKYIGGLVGVNKGGTIKNSYATGDVAGEKDVGGFVGWNDGTISGKNYWKVGSATQGVGAGRGVNVERKTDAELKALDATETGWSSAIWNFEAGEYPKLAWQD